MINSRKSSCCNFTVSNDIEFLLSTNLNLISNKAVNENSNLFFKTSTKTIELGWKIVPTCHNLIVSWIFFLANFDDKFAEPIIKFTLVDYIQNFRIYLGECSQLTTSAEVGQIVAFFCPFKRDWGCLPLLKFFIIKNIREFKKWRRQRQRQGQKSMIWLVEWRKIMMLHVQHAFWCNVLT